MEKQTQQKTADNSHEVHFDMRANTMMKVIVMVMMSYLLQLAKDDGVIRVLGSKTDVFILVI